MGRLVRQFIKAHKYTVGRSALPSRYTAANENMFIAYADYMATTGRLTGFNAYLRVGINGYGSVYAVRGLGEVAVGITLSGGTSYIIGVHGHARNLGTINAGNTMVAGLLGQILTGGIYTALSHITPCWLDWASTTIVSSGITQLLYMTNNSSLELNHVIFLHGGIGGISNFIEFEACIVKGFISKSGNPLVHHGESASIRCTIDGEVFYFLVSKAPANT